MSAATEDQPVIDERIWNAWVLKGKLREQAADRTARVLAGAALVLLATGSALYVVL